MTDFFQLNPNFDKPYALMDLDDTLFQTLRKIEVWDLPSDNLMVATVNKQGDPLSYFTPKQVQFFNWLYHSTELIPVTARDTTEIGRVKLPFTSWQVLTHGAVILGKDGLSLASWEMVIAENLSALQAVIIDIKNFVEANFAELNLRLTLHNEKFLTQSLAVYLAIKQSDKDHTILQILAKTLTKQFPNFSQYFYCHINANNLAILPHSVHKRYAVQFLIEQHFDNNRAMFGFGDSLTDLPFLQLLDWYGTPSQGQLHQFFCH